MTDYWMQGGGGYSNAFIRSLDASFGKHARQRREFLDYSQGHVAMLLQTTYGIRWHQTVVAKIESGERLIKLAEAYALADIYGIPLEDLAHGNNLDHVMHWTREVRDGKKKLIGRRGPGKTGAYDGQSPEAS